MDSWAAVNIPPLALEKSLPTLMLFNTETRSIEPLTFKKRYQMYVCGITPYDATHLGHANTYLAFDLIHRYLLNQGSTVNYIQNITDIDDPLLERAQRDGLDWENLAHSQIELFRGDMVDLHILPPTHYIGAVESIPLVDKAISSLQEVNATYQVSEDTYFNVEIDEKFGSLSQLDRESMTRIFAERGGDPTRVGKRNPLDALLWLSKRPGEPSWSSSCGEGRPGWHIECCAIALHYVEQEVDSDFSLDIQGGGNDLIFPHHEMSTSQGRILSGKKFAKFYVHSGMIGLEGEKMSKSKGNLIFVSTLVKQGVDPMVIRLALLLHHYRSDHSWSDQDLIDALFLVERLRINLSRIEVAPTREIVEGILSSLSDDLDTPRVMNLLRQWCTSTEEGNTGGNPGELSRAIDSLLGIAL